MPSYRPTVKKDDKGTMVDLPLDAETVKGATVFKDVTLTGSLVKFTKTDNTTKSFTLPEAQLPGITETNEYILTAVNKTHDLVYENGKRTVYRADMDLSGYVGVFATTGGYWQQLISDPNAGTAFTYRKLSASSGTRLSGMDSWGDGRYVYRVYVVFEPLGYYDCRVSIYDNEGIMRATRIFGGTGTIVRFKTEYGDDPGDIYCTITRLVG